MSKRTCLVLIALAAGLVPGTRGALAAESSAPAAGPWQPRFALDHARLTRTPDAPQSGGRFTLQSRLQAPSPAPQSAGGYALSATLVPSGTASCGAAADLVFANGFE
jgi:hypothetical protein